MSLAVCSTIVVIVGSKVGRLGGVLGVGSTIGFIVGSKVGRLVGVFCLPPGKGRLEKLGRLTLLADFDLLDFVVLPYLATTKRTPLYQRDTHTQWCVTSHMSCLQITISLALRNELSND